MSIRREQLEDIMREVAAANGAVGFGAAVLVGDRLVQASAGPANPELDASMTNDTLVQIGSIAKMMNAVLIMRLVEQGTLDLDLPVCEFIPGFRLADESATKTLTLRHCLTMTSGIDGGPIHDFGFGEDCLSRYVASLPDVPQLYPPGGGFSYSSAASVVAGHVAERATGQRWDDLLREHVLEPAGMAQTETMPDRLMFQRVAVGVGPGGEVVRPWSPTLSMGPAGSTAAATAGDLTRFARIFLSGGLSTTGTRVLSSESTAAMTVPAVAVLTGHIAHSWCLGPSRTDTGADVILGHVGGNSSGGAVLWWIPGLDAAIACVTNSVWSFFALVECQREIARRLGCEPPGDPQPDAAGHVGDRDDLTGTYERLNVRYDVTAGDKGLCVQVRAGEAAVGEADGVVRLLPAGRHLFLPERSLSGFGPPSPIAFPDYAGVRVLLDGHEAARKVG